MHERSYAARATRGAAGETYKLPERSGKHANRVRTLWINPILLRHSKWCACGVKLTRVFAFVGEHLGVLEHLRHARRDAGSYFSCLLQPAACVGRARRKKRANEPTVRRRTSGGPKVLQAGVCAPRVGQRDGGTA